MPLPYAARFPVFVHPSISSSFFRVTHSAAFILFRALPVPGNDRASFLPAAVAAVGGGTIALDLELLPRLEAPLTSATFRRRF